MIIKDSFAFQGPKRRYIIPPLMSKDKNIEDLPVWWTKSPKTE